nr:glycoside hydrolase family 3 C-terminal domain-containing protein [Anaerobium acetethylicum]
MAEVKERKEIMNIKEIVSQMTLEEKAGMCSGLDFWHTKPVERLGVPAVMVSDGPHGLRKQSDEADHLGINDSITAVCFPAACATACTFDRELMHEMGVTLGKECQAENVSVLLGPAVNIKRSPLCGRNFEYLSEDPFLAGELSASYINGVQSQNVGTSIKHFAANNQEHERMAGSSEMDERTLREIYLPSFETAVKKAQPWTVMCSYNRINGIFASENKKLLNDILKEEWGFEGFVMSDWGAVSDRVAGVIAGLELEMPGSNGVNDKEIVKAVQTGIMEEGVLDKAVERILNIVFRFVENRKMEVFDREADHKKAVEIAKQCIVLLKNDGILPLKEQEENVAFIGGFAAKPRYQGGGSSHINSYKVPSTVEMAAKYGTIKYAEGFSAVEDKVDEALLAEAVETAKHATKVVVFAGLPDLFESEGYDRTHMNLPECQNRLIEEILKVQKNVIVVLHNGSPVALPWADRVTAIVEAYLGGEGIAEAIADTLYGKANPSGKLAESFPLRIEDTPSYLNFPGTGKKVFYREGVFVGYRYYDTKKMDVLFPFGYGLSYTSFELSNFAVSKKNIRESETLTVSADVTNTGAMAGKEVVQLYVRDNTGAAVRPEKELKGFEAVSLQPGETKTVSMELDKRAFAWYNEEINDWYAATGDYTILVGNSSRNILFEETIRFESETELPFEVTKDTMIGEIVNHPKLEEYVKKNLLPLAASLTQNTDESWAAMMEAMLKYLPIRSLRSFDNVSNELMNKAVEEMNELLK